MADDDENSPAEICLDDDLSERISDNRSEMSIDLDDVGESENEIDLGLGMKEEVAAPAGLVSAFQWHFYAYGFLTKLLPFDLHSSLLAHAGHRVSTCFSGIGCAEIGLEMVQAAARQNLTDFSFLSVSACDCSRACQDSLHQTNVASRCSHLH